MEGGFSGEDNQEGKPAGTCYERGTLRNEQGYATEAKGLVVTEGAAAR